MTANCANLRLTNSIDLIDVNAEQIDEIRKDEFTNNIAIYCSNTFPEVKSGDAVTIVGTRNYNGTYTVLYVRNASRWPYNADSPTATPTDPSMGRDRSVRQRYLGRTIVVLNKHIDDLEEFYESQPGGPPVIYINKSVRRIVNHSGELKNYPVDTWFDQSEELNRQESATIQVGLPGFSDRIKSILISSELPESIITGMSFDHISIPGEVSPPDYYTSIAYKPETVLFVQDTSDTDLIGSGKLRVKISQPNTGWVHYFYTSASINDKNHIAVPAFNQNLLNSINSKLNPILVSADIGSCEKLTATALHLSSDQEELVIYSSHPGEHLVFTIEILDLSTGLDLIASRTTSVSQNSSLYYQYAEDPDYRSTSPFASTDGRFYQKIDRSLLFPNLSMSQGSILSGNILGFRSVSGSISSISIGNIVDARSIGTFKTFAAGRN